MSDRPIPSDYVYATCVLSPTRLLATFYWARYRYYGKPLVLCAFELAPLGAESWSRVAAQLYLYAKERHARNPNPLGLWVESDIIAAQARDYAKLDAKTLAPHIVAVDSWQTICQSAAGFLTRGDVGYTKEASEQMQQRPFLNEAGVMAGPKADDNTQPGMQATVAAFIYGVVIGLDPVAANDPKPREPKRASRK